MLTVSDNELHGRLAHEGEHVRQDLDGELDDYDFPDERKAYDAGFATDSEFNPDGAWNPSDEWINSTYEDSFDAW